MSEPIKTTLPNGVRIVSETVDHVGSASIGLWCRTGSSHETDREAGITHFIEHMLFKGTERRTAKGIAEEIEGRGGMLNAFTDKEQTCYYCRVLADDAPVAVDVLCDMVRHSKLDPEELDREKGVVLEEIKRSEDEPDDHVHDLHLETLWPDHILGKPVIGTPESVSSFSRDDLATYINRRYRGPQILLAAAGRIEHEAFVEWAGEFLGDLPGDEPTPILPRPAATAGETYVSKEVEQVHFCIGTTGTSFYDEDLYPSSVLDGILGGGMSSRLFQEVRERRGLAYAVGSYNLHYTAGGAFTIYGGTGRQTWPEVQRVVRDELDKLMNDGPTEAELARVKRNVSGSIVLALEAMSSRMMRMARNEFIHGRHIPVAETLEKVNAVTAAQIQDLSQRMFRPEQMRTTVIGPA